jgi:hypothetical protein
VTRDAHLILVGLVYGWHLDGKSWAECKRRVVVMGLHPRDFPALRRAVERHLEAR